MNGWSRRPVALHSVAYPHQCEQPAVTLRRRGTHRAAHTGAQALRAVVDVVVHVYGLPVHLRLQLIFTNYIARRFFDNLSSE